MKVIQKAKTTYAKVKANDGPPCRDCLAVCKKCPPKTC